MIFVVGAARSGTTLVTRILEQCGARLGDANSLAEHMPFKKKWIYPQLQKRGFDPFGQNPIPWSAIDDMGPAKVRSDLGPILDGVDCVKDVKSVHFWPILAAAFPEAVWLIVWRDPRRIAASCVRTKFMKAYATEKEWETWADVYHDRCRELQAAYPDRVFNVDVVGLRDNPEGISGAARAAGLQWDDTAVDRAFNPSKWTG